MARPISSNLQNMLALGAVETHTTLDITTAAAVVYRFATKDLTLFPSTIGERTYAANLRRADELKQSVFAPPDRVTLSIQNVDKNFGFIVAAEDLVRAVAVIGRVYQDQNEVLEDEWVELFRGEVRPVSFDEKEAKLEILNDLAACGYCVGHWTLSEACQFIFKHAATCGYAGLEALCNKKRKSAGGCTGRNNEERYGGMESADVPVTTPPAGGTTGGGGWHTCPREDQYVLVAENGCIVSKPAGFVIAGDMLFDPIARSVERVRSAEIFVQQPIWCVTSNAGVKGFSSFTHPIFPFSSHPTGVPVSDVRDGDQVLLWSGDRDCFGHSIAESYDTGELGDVVRIELESGHVYAYGNNPDLYIVCHNSKPVGGGD